MHMYCIYCTYVSEDFDQEKWGKKTILLPSFACATEFVLNIEL